MDVLSKVSDDIYDNIYANHHFNKNNWKEENNRINLHFIDFSNKYSTGSTPRGVEYLKANHNTCES